MKYLNQRYVIISLLCSSQLVSSFEIVQLAQQLNTFSESIKHSNRIIEQDVDTWTHLHETLKAKSWEKTTPLYVTYEQFTSALQRIVGQQLATLNATSPPPKKYTTDSNRIYIQKLIIPQESKIYFFGDLHGDIASLVLSLAQLKKLRVIDNNWLVQGNNYIFFGGDCVDRGNFSVEVITTICQLKLLNENRVFFIRGNHEDTELNFEFGFRKEYKKKFEKELSISATNKEFFTLLKEFYASLPVAIFVGIQQHDKKTYYVQLCHGGLELYDIHPLLQQKGSTLPGNAGSLTSHVIQSMNRRQFLEDLQKNTKTLDLKDDIKTGGSFERRLDEKTPTTKNSGFMWNDFNASPQVEIHQTGFHSGRGFSMGSTLAHEIFDAISLPHHKVVGIIRGHQHNETMPQLLNDTAIKDANKKVLEIFNHETWELSHLKAHQPPPPRPQPFPLSGDGNGGVYKLPWQPKANGSQHHAFTTVATYKYTPSPSFLCIRLDAPPPKSKDSLSGWIMTNFYIPGFNDSMLKPNASTLLSWNGKTQGFTQWKNAVNF